MRTLFTLFALTLVLLAPPPSGSAPAGSALDKDEITKELFTRGKTRAYYLYVPSTIKPDTKAPLILMLHGSGRNGITLVEKWKDYAKKEGIIIAGPDASNSRGWSAPQDGPDYLYELSKNSKPNTRSTRGAFTCLDIRQAPVLPCTCR